MPGSSSPSDQSAPTTPLDALALHPIYLPDLLDTLHQHQQQPAVYYPQPHLQPQPQQQYLSGGSDPVIYRRESHNAYAGRVVQQQLSPRDHNYFLSNSARREGRSAGPFPNQQSRDGLATSASASLTPVAGASSTATVPPPPQSSNNVQDNANTQANSNHMQHNWNNVQHNNSNNTDMQYSGTNAQQNNSNDGNAQYNGNNAPYNNSTQYGSYSNNNALNSANTQNSTSNVQQNSNNNAPAPPPHPLSGEAIDATTDVHPGLALPSPFSQAHGGGGEVPDISLTALPAPEELPSCVSGEVADRRASHLPFHHRNTITSSNASTPAPAVDGGGSTTSAPGTAHPLGVSSPSSTPTESAHTTTNNVMHVNVPRGPTSASPLQHTGSTDPQSETTHTDAPLLTAENTAASMATVGGGGGQSMSPRERQNTASPPPLMLSSPRTLSPNPQQPSTTTTTTTTNNLTREKKDVKDDGRASPPTTSAGPDGGEVLHVLPYNYSARRGGDHTPISVSPNRLLLHEGTPLRPTFSTEMIDFHAESPPHHMATQDVQGILHPSGRNSPALRSPTLRDEDRRNTINTNSSSSPNNTNSDGTPTSLRGGGRNFDLDVKRRYSRHFQPGQSTTSDYGAEATMAEDSSARYSPSFMNGVHSRHEFVQLSNAIIQPQYLRPQQEAEDGTGEATGNDAVGARQEAVMEEDEPNRAKDFFTPSPSPHADHPSPTGSPQSPQLVDDATPPSSSPTPTPTPATQATPTIDSEHVPVIDLRMLRSAALSPNISEGGWADASAHHHDHHQAEMVDVAPLCLPLRAEEVCEPRPKTAVLFTSLQSYLEHAAKEHPSPSIVDASNNNNNNHDEANNTQARTLDASVHPQQHTQEMKTQRMLLMDDEPLVAVRESARSHVDATRMSTMASMHDDLVGSPLAEDATYFPHVHDENGVQRSKHKVPSSSTARATAEWVAHGFTTQQQPKNKDVDDGVSSRHEHDGTPLNSSSTTPAPTTSSPLLSPSNQSSPQPSRMDETSPLHNTKLLAPHPPPRPAGQTSSSSQSNIITTPCVVHHAKKRSSQHPHQQEQQQQQQHDVGSSSRRQSSSNRRDDDVRARQHDSVAVAPPPPHASPNYGPLYAVSLWQPPSSSTNSSGTSRDETPAMTHNAAVVHHHDAAPPHAAHSGLVGDPVHHGQQGTRRRHTRGGHRHPFMPLPPLHDERSGMRPFWIHHPSNRGDDGPWKLVPLPKRYARAAW